jgi:hypothetical protein
MKNDALQTVFTTLKLILAKHSSERVVVEDTETCYYLNEAAPDAKGKPIFFAMVKRSADKVAFHLMPVYTHPELLSKISPELKKRMQGKSCFNFNSVDAALFKELERIAKASAAVAK